MTEAKEQCPSHKGETSGSDSYSYNHDKKMGHCFSCGLKTWEYNGILWGKHPGGKTFNVKSGKTAQEIAEEQEDEYFEYTPKAIEEDTSVGENTSHYREYVSWRGISADTMEHFGVTTEGHQVFFKYPSGGNKVRDKQDKKFHAVGLKADELFGMNLFPAGCAKKITVTEGEIDTLSAWQMLKNGNYLNPVVSVPSANPSGKFWEKTKDYLDSFNEIILSVDNDGPGKKLAEKFSLMFPGKVKVMNHGQHKDANDFLMNGEAQSYKNAWWSAKQYRPDDILMDADDYLNLYDESPDFEYFPTNIPELDEKILGINKGYFTVIQAPTGIGKSEFMRYLQWQCYEHGKYKFAYMHLEESRLRSLLGLVSYKLGENVTLKKFIDDKGLDEEVREAITEITSSERMVQFNYNPEDGYEDLLQKIKYMVAAFEVDYVFFEPIQDLVNGEDKEGKLADLSSRLGTMASDLGVGIVTIAHQNKQGDTLYASMIGKKAAFEITLHRDQEAESPEERNRTYVRVGRKNRVGLGNGHAGALDFDLESFTLNPVEAPKEPKGVTTDDF